MEAAHEAGDAYLMNINSGFLGLAMLRRARRAFAAEGESEEAKYGLANLDAAARRYLS